MECKFVVGQKVVCINDEVEFGRVKGIKYKSSDLHGLKKGNIYTIAEIFPCNIARSGISVVVAEIGCRTSPLSIDRGYDHTRFAPLKEKKTDISVFTEILNKVNGGNHDNNYEFSLDELFETVKK